MITETEIKELAALATPEKELSEEQIEELLTMLRLTVDTAMQSAGDKCSNSTGYAIEAIRLMLEIQERHGRGESVGPARPPKMIMPENDPGISLDCFKFREKE